MTSVANIEYSSNDYPHLKLRIAANSEAPKQLVVLLNSINFFKALGSEMLVDKTILGSKFAHFYSIASVCI